MGLILAPDEIKTNMEVLRSYLNSTIERYNNVLERVHEYYDEESLDTESFRESKDKMAICYRLIAEGMISAQESISGDIDTLLGCIGDEYLNEEELKAQIEKLRVQCEQYEQKIKNMQAMKFFLGAISVRGVIENYQNMIENCKEQIAVLQDKLFFLREAEDLTVNLFQLAMGSLTTVQNAIRDAGVNVREGNFPTKLEWLTVPDTDEVKAIDDCEEISISRTVCKGNYPEAYIKLLTDYEEAGIVDGRFELYNNGETIAYGHDVRVGEDFSKGLSMEEGLALLIHDLDEKYGTIEDHINMLDNDYGFTIDINGFTDDEMLFFLDFAYNRGVGLVKRDDLEAVGKPYSSLDILIVAVSENDDETIKKVLMEEIYNLKGKKYDGLIRRRMDEYEILKLGDYERDYDLNRDYTQPKQ